MKILAVIVTHNRRELLKRCIDHIKTQTRPPDQLLVINNASTDSTEQFLISNKINHVTQENLGSAGGWHAGIKYSLDKKFDACWLMDDDGFPDTNALEILEKNLNHKTSCVSSVVLKEDDKTKFVFPMPRLNSHGNPVLSLINRKTKFHSLLKPTEVGVYPFAHLFNGALISTNHIKIIGNINVNYFMFGDEVDYFYRLRKVGEVKSILTAFHYHPDVEKRPYSKMKIYYLIKNSIILHKKYFDHHFLRNSLIIPLIIYRVIHRNGLLFFINFLFNKRMLFLKATYRGFCGVISKDYEK